MKPYFDNSRSLPLCRVQWSEQEHVLSFNEKTTGRIFLKILLLRQRTFTVKFSNSKHASVRSFAYGKPQITLNYRNSTSNPKDTFLFRLQKYSDSHAWRKTASLSHSTVQAARVIWNSLRGPIWNYCFPPPSTYPSGTKTKDLFINVRCHYFKYSLWKYMFFFHASPTKTGKSEKSQLLKETPT